MWPIWNTQFDRIILLILEFEFFKPIERPKCVGIIFERIVNRAVLAGAVPVGFVPLAFPRAPTEVLDVVFAVTE